ncbi:MAG: 2-oxoacid:acceptor oxidoreductase family protein [Thermoplasmatota archaeon]
MKANIQFCGFGGQGIILSSTVLGNVAVKGPNLNAVQTQSFGSEARGGECQAELIISDDQIFSPSPDEVDLLVALSQTAYDEYKHRLKDGGVLIIDPELVTDVEEENKKVIKLEARNIAQNLGNELVANMVVLGFLQASTQLFSKEVLFDVIKESVHEKFVEIDIKAAEKGISIAKEMDIDLGDLFNESA